MAGVRTVISSLWPLSDVAAAAMMSRLYDHGDRTVSQRLRSLQLEEIGDLRARGLPDHPLNWGAIIAMGDWR
jgi:CHAT domain-containing protein